MTQEERRQLVEEARRRHGRPFRCEQLIGTLAEERRRAVDAGREIPAWLRVPVAEPAKHPSGASSIGLGRKVAE